ncbi:hypothetical protein ACEQ8H_006409 [Pleosporales sp. CAS-2024a]
MLPNDTFNLRSWKAFINRLVFGKPATFVAHSSLFTAPAADVTSNAPSTHYTTDFASQIIIEDFNDPADLKPDRYLGTVAGARICARTEEEYSPCGTAGTHYLICGHIVVGVTTGDTRCGANCKTAATHQEPFNCLLCHDAVNRIIGQKLQSGRSCEVIGKLCEQKTFLDMYLECRPTMERKKDAIREALRARVLNTHAKRKALDEEQSAPDLDGKKQRRKLAPCNEPITEATHGKKRKDMQGEQIAPKMGSKKQRHKLETHKEPMTDASRGEKRSQGVSDLEAKQEANKRPQTSRLLDMGDAIFISTVAGRKHGREDSGRGWRRMGAMSNSAV